MWSINTEDTNSLDDSEAVKVPDNFEAFDVADNSEAVNEAEKSEAVNTADKSVVVEILDSSQPHSFQDSSTLLRLFMSLLYDSSQVIGLSSEDVLLNLKFEMIYTVVYIGRIEFEWKKLYKYSVNSPLNR